MVDKALSLSSIDELLAKSNLLADFKAVKDGNVWCTGKNLFQETTELGTMIEDIHTILTTDDDSLDELVSLSSEVRTLSSLSVCSLNAFSATSSFPRSTA